MEAADFFFYTASIVLIIFVIGNIIFLVMVVGLFQRLMRTIERVGETTTHIERKIQSTYVGFLDGVINLIHFFARRR